MLTPKNIAEIQGYLDADGVTCKKGAEGILVGVHASLPHAEQVRSLASQLHDARIELAHDAVTLRSVIILPDGLPDWGGTSRAYKRAVGFLIDEAQPTFESRVTVANQIQRSVTRLLPAAVLNTVLREQKIKLTEEVKQRLLLNGAAVAEGGLDPQIQLIIKEVNRHFRVGQHSNWPRSPFEQKQVTTPTIPA